MFNKINSKWLFAVVALLILLGSVIVVPIYHLSVNAEPPPAWDPEAFDYVETGFPTNGIGYLSLKTELKGMGPKVRLN